MKNIIVAFGLLVMGCGELNTVPSTIALDPTFTESQQEVIKDSLDNTCRAVGFCPEIVDWGNAPNRIIRETDWSKWTNMGLTEDDGLNDFTNVYIHARKIGGNLDLLWFVVTHELLHYGIPGHPVKSGIMVHHLYLTPDMPMCIDQEAADAWCKIRVEGGCVSTCEI